MKDKMRESIRLWPGVWLLITSKCSITRTYRHNLKVLVETLYILLYVTLRRAKADEKSRELSRKEVDRKRVGRNREKYSPVWRGVGGYSTFKKISILFVFMWRESMKVWILIWMCRETLLFATEILGYCSSFSTISLPSVAQYRVLQFLI